MLRVALLLGLLLTSTTARANPWADEDDPKIARAHKPRHSVPVPRFKLAYRYLPMPMPDATTLTFHAIGFDVYPISTWVRLGFGVDGSYGGGPLRAFYSSISVSLGVQYPWKVTPFLEGRFALGLLGGTFEKNVATTVMIVGGIEAGLEVHAYKRLYFDATFGWAHPRYKAPDVVAYQRDPARGAPIKKFTGDVFTFKLGLGF